MRIHDLLIIGGGINGAGIARDAAGRGLDVVLCEKNDLASGTSSKSSKLIHGGLRYLEYGEFRLVREALNEREVLLRAAPHLVRSLRIVLPHHKGLRPKWMLRLGLFLYDHLGGRKILPPTSVANLQTGPYKAILKSIYKTGYVFSDCWVDDARLVVLNAYGARARGATVMSRTKCTGLSHADGIWRAELTPHSETLHPQGEPQIVHAKAVVNASGIRVDETIELALGRAHEDHLRLVKGSHIVTKKLYNGPQLYMFQNADKRIVFAIPYEQDYTLIGTTDVGYKLDAAPIEISEPETQYLIDAVNQYFRIPLAAHDIRWSYAGVRPLYDNKKQNASAVTRDYVFDLIDDETPPILSIFGGKITTYRELAEHALDKLKPYFPQMSTPWTQTTPLPGGDIQNADFEAFFTRLKSRYGWIAPLVLRRMGRAYGTLIDEIIGDATAWKDMGRDFGAGLSEREVRYLMAHEWAVTADDILWRRSKLGLHMSQAEIDAFHAWMDAQVGKT